VGMAPELLAAPFEPMRQRRTRTSGAGLGLSIAKAIVTAHGGSIELGRPARGTQLRIRLPVEVPARPADDGHALTAPGAGAAHPPVLAGGSGALAGWRQGAGADA
jgi:histidine kinase/DNA gyrase B/HSP90-like ATPase